MEMKKDNSVSFLHEIRMHFQRSYETKRNTLILELNVLQGDNHKELRFSAHTDQVAASFPFFICLSCCMELLLSQISARNTSWRDQGN